MRTRSPPKSVRGEGCVQSRTWSPQERAGGGVCVSARSHGLRAGRRHLDDSPAAAAPCTPGPPAELSQPEPPGHARRAGDLRGVGWRAPCALHVRGLSGVCSPRAWALRSVCRVRGLSGVGVPCSSLCPHRLSTFALSSSTNSLCLCQGGCAVILPQPRVGRTLASCAMSYKRASSGAGLGISKHDHRGHLGRGHDCPSTKCWPSTLTHTQTRAHR